jgi:predicted metal-dependent peptidase
MSGVAVPGAAEDLVTLWKTRLAAAAQQAARAGRLSESWLRALDRLIQPQLPWRALLARFLMSVARDDYSFQRPSRREGEAILPRLSSAGIEVVVALDTSGSIGEAELAEFASEVDALKGQVRARVALHACDQTLDPRGPWVFESWEQVVLPKDLKGGGGTRFTPVFEWIGRERLRPDLLIYFTDAEGEFPERAPDYPVVWLVKGRAPVPWGERVQLN